MTLETHHLTDGPSVASLISSYQHEELKVSFKNEAGYIYQVRITGLMLDGASREGHNFVGVIQNPRFILDDGLYAEGWFFTGSPRYGFMHVSDQRLPMYSEVGSSVFKMYVNCSLQMRNFERGGVAASDCCGYHAISAVYQPSNGNWYYRCLRHEGLLDLKKRGRRARSIVRSPR